MKNKQMIIIFCILAIFLIATCTFVSLYAKYLKTKESNLGIQSDKFYFTLELLGDTNEEADLSKEYTLYGGDSKLIPFTIQNYFDELRINQTDITYNVSVTEGSEYASVDLVTEQSFNGGIQQEKECILTINDGYAHNTKVVVEVTSTAPYVKTMKLIFILSTFESNLHVFINDSVGSLYLELIIDSNVDVVAKNISIDYSSINATTDELLADVTNSYLLDEGNTLVTNALPAGATYLTSLTITKPINTGEAISIIMFKNNPSNDYSSINIELLTSVDALSNNVYTIVLG